MNYIIKNTKNYFNLPIRLIKTYKGTYIVANKDIKKGTIVSYFKMKVYYHKDYKGVNNDMYIFNVYNSEDEYFEDFIADIYEDTIEQPINNITFWGHLANEPSIDESSNTFVNSKSSKNINGNIKKGDIVIYELTASKDIKKDDEITWCFGGGYIRNYEISNECKI